MAGQQTARKNLQDDVGIYSPIIEGYELLAKTEGNSHTLDLLVSGVRCAGCIQKIESTLNALSEVNHARLNFSTGRLVVDWQGESLYANKLVNIIQSLGYAVRPYTVDAEKQTAEAETHFLLLCLGVAGFAAGNIMLLSVGLWTTTAETMGLATRELLHWVSALIAIPAIMFAGQPFFRSAFAALSKGRTNMDVPISVGLVLASGMSLFETASHGEHVYFDSAVMLMFFLLIGRYLDSRARRVARSAATDLLASLSGFATVIEENKTRQTPIRDLREDMLVLVAAGEKIPVDGIITNGTSGIDTSLVTGESVPRQVGPNENVYAGTLNISAPIHIRVMKASEDSLLADIVRLMEKATQAQAQYVRIADRMARLYTPIVHVMAALAFIVWFGILHAAWQKALMIAVTVLIITCPCALGLAVPVVQVLATGILFRKGIFVKSGDALERLAAIDTALFDKTGTLTQGQPQLTGVYDADTLQLAASLAVHSRHPISQAVTRHYTGELLPVSDIEELKGKGLEAVWQGRKIRLGSRAWCGDNNSHNASDLELWLAYEGQPPALLTFSDTLKNDAKDTIERLQLKGIEIEILSGDRPEIVESITSALGIMKAQGGLTPIEKFSHLKNLQSAGHKVLMVGDGLNDAPVLAGADISMAPGTAIDMAQNAADIVFMGTQLAPVDEAHTIATLTQKLVRQNFILAILYNVVAIPLAFCGFVTPFIAALAMSGSSLVVIANSFRLKWVA